MLAPQRAVSRFSLLLLEVTIMPPQEQKLVHRRRQS